MIIWHAISTEYHYYSNVFECSSYICCPLLSVQVNRKICWLYATILTPFIFILMCIGSIWGIKNFSHEPTNRQTNILIQAPFWSLKKSNKNFCESVSCLDYFSACLHHVSILVKWHWLIFNLHTICLTCFILIEWASL